MATKVAAGGGASHSAAGTDTASAAAPLLLALARRKGGCRKSVVHGITGPTICTTSGLCVSGSVLCVQSSRLVLGLLCAVSLGEQRHSDAEEAKHRSS